MERRAPKKNGRPRTSARPFLSQGGERSIFIIGHNGPETVSRITNKTYLVVIRSWIWANLAGPIPDTSSISSICAKGP